MAETNNPLYARKVFSGDDTVNRGCYLTKVAFTEDKQKLENGGKHYHVLFQFIIVFLLFIVTALSVALMMSLAKIANLQGAAPAICQDGYMQTDPGTTKTQTPTPPNTIGNTPGQELTRPIFGTTKTQTPTPPNAIGNTPGQELTRPIFGTTKTQTPSPFNVIGYTPGEEVTGPILSFGGSCFVRANEGTRVHAAAFLSQTERSTIYSCIGGRAGSRDVHVLGVYESAVHTRPPTAGNIVVNIIAVQSASRPVILVFANYEPVNWILNAPDYLNIEKVILISYYSSQSSVVVNGGRNNQVLVEKQPSWPRGYGNDSGGGDTSGLLFMLTQLYTDVTSFAGTYKADSWNWNLPSRVAV